MGLRAILYSAELDQLRFVNLARPMTLVTLKRTINWGDDWAVLGLDDNPPSPFDGCYVYDQEAKAAVMDLEAARACAIAMVRSERDALWVSAAWAARRDEALQGLLDAAGLKAIGDQLRAAPEDARLQDAETPDELIDAMTAVIAEIAGAVG